MDGSTARLLGEQRSTEFNMDSPANDGARTPVEDDGGIILPTRSAPSSTNNMNASLEPTSSRVCIVCFCAVKTLENQMLFFLKWHLAACFVI